MPIHVQYTESSYALIRCYSTPSSFPQKKTAVTRCTGCHRRRRQQSQGRFLSASHTAWNRNPSTASVPIRRLSKVFLADLARLRFLVGHLERHRRFWNSCLTSMRLKRLKSAGSQVRRLCTLSTRHTVAHCTADGLMQCDSAMGAGVEHPAESGTRGFRLHSRLYDRSSPVHTAC